MFFFYIIINNHFIWNEPKGIWEIDKKEQIKNKIERFLSVELPRMSAGLNNEVVRGKFNQYIDRVQNNAAINGIISCIRRNVLIQASSEDLDQKNHYFSCMNLDYNSKKLKFSKHNRRRMLSMQSGVKVFRDNHDTTWKDFLLDIMQDDYEMYSYILRVIGYTMLGDPRDDCMFILYGPTTRNGKSTFINGLKKYFGDYAITIEPGSITKSSRNAGGVARPDIVRLKGKRFVNIAESSNNHILDASLIKTITGGDTITARKLYSDYEEFVNQSVFFLHTNHLPKIDDETILTSRRLIIIPFDKQFQIDEIDVDMYKKLSAPRALYGLFDEVRKTWKKYNEVSMKSDLPKRIVDAIKELEYKSDDIKRFLNENIKISDQSNEWTSIKNIHRRYMFWAKRNNLEKISSKMMSMKLKEKGYKLHRRSEGNGVCGIRLKKF